MYLRILRIALLVILLLLAASFLPARCSPTVSSWIETADGYMTYNWVINGARSTTSRFATLVSETAHFTGNYSACGWTFTLSRYNDDWKRYLQPSPSGYMWAYYYRTALGTPPDTLMFGLTTSADFVPGTTQYGLVSDATASYGPVLAPTTTPIPEPTPIIVLFSGIIACTVWRRH